MPNTNSAKKRMKTSEKAHARNIDVKSSIAGSRRKLIETLSQGNTEQAQTLYKEYCSAIDKAVKKGVIKQSAANRRKSRAAARLAKAS